MADSRRRPARRDLREDGDVVTFLITSLLRDFAGGQSTLHLDAPAATAGEALAALWRQYPGLRDRIVNERGEVRQHVNVFIGDDNIKQHEGLATPVQPDSEITIVPAVSGG